MTMINKKKIKKTEKATLKTFQTHIPSIYFSNKNKKQYEKYVKNSEHKNTSFFKVCLFSFISLNKNMRTSLSNSINDYIICSECQSEFDSGMTDSGSIQEYTKLDVGFTDVGVQVWCRRCEKNVCHIDFEDNDLEADFRCIIASSSSNN